MVKRHRKREKRFRPDKIISEREFLTGEQRTKEDLPKGEDLVIIDPRKTFEPKAANVNDKTRKYLGSGKKPKWMDCQEEEVNEGDEKREKKET